MENEFKMGDKVVWDFVFDVPEENGVVVGLDGNRVEVEYKGYNNKMYRDWLEVDEVMLESNWVF